MSKVKYLYADELFVFLYLRVALIVVAYKTGCLPIIHSPFLPSKQTCILFTADMCPASQTPLQLEGQVAEFLAELVKG